MTGSEFTGWQLVKTTVMPHEQGVEEKIYLWEPKKDPDVRKVRISVIESAYWRHAQQHLATQLEHCMNSDMPRGKGKSGGIGDIQFLGQVLKTTSVSQVFFTRGNLRISVQSVGRKPVDVTIIAKKLDERLVKPPSASEKKRGVVAAKKPVRLKVKEREMTTVLDKLPAPRPGAGMTRVILDDGELRREGDVLFCVSEIAGLKKAEIFNYKLE
jgi:hypothetical protein